MFPKVLYEASDYGKLVSLWPMAIIAKNKELNSASSQFSFLAIGQILTFLLRFLLLGTHHVLILVIFLLGWGLI